ncbi:MAG: M35 family metallo-endopeptidase, partial [Gaiellales bacterium]
MRIPRTVLALVAACLVAPAAATAAPQATLSPVESGARVVLRVEIANPDAEPIRVLRRAVGAGSLAGPAFTVTLDGEPVAYVGALAKYGPPADSDYLTVPARGAASLDVELAGAYAFTRTGTYAIRLVASDPALVVAADGGVVATALRSEELTLTAAAPPGPVPSPVRPSAVRSIGALSLSFENCSAVAPGGGVASEQDRIAQAIIDATGYADESTAYFENRRAGARYVEWFGVRTPARWNAVRDNYALALAVFETGSIVVECHNADCGGASTYAYVYPHQPYAIYVCGGFWSAPATGTDSKAGTLVHEMMHFTTVAGTDDHVYGQTAARALAVSTPQDAVDNS